jgi:hypothetical protein
MTFITLSEAKSHLRYPNPVQPNSDDLGLQIFIDAVQEVLTYECDDLTPTLHSERHNGGSYKIFTYHSPVLSVENVQENWGWITYDLDFQDAGADPASTSMFGYSIDTPETGEISRRTVASTPIPFIPGEKNIFIQYTSGRATLPPDIKLAALELLAHAWQNSQLRSVSMSGGNIGYDAVEGALYSRDTESGVQNINIGIPYRILEFIKGKRHMPFFA